MFDIAPSKLLIALRVCADYSMVWLAKEKNDGPIGMNYLDKIGIPHVYALVGAMLAGVDYLTVGAGIPDSFPIMIDAVLSGQLVKYPVPVSEIGRSTFHEMCFDPSGFFGENLPEMKRPAFFPVIASNLLAQVLLRMKKLQGKIDGFVIEGPTAGGHNAPPRDHEVDASGDPVYNERDVVNFRKIADYGLPFWIGGGIASPEKLRWAISEGAVGGQIGTAFAFCQESGMDPELRRRVARLAYEGKLKIRTSSLASPTGFPFKTVEGLDGTLTDPHIQVERACTRGALRTLFRKIDGSIGYRCPAEPVDIYVSKGGLHEDTAGRQCICNGLLATAGLGNSDFPKIVTSGDDLPRLMRALMNGPDDDYTVDKVFEYLAA